MRVTPLETTARGICRLLHSVPCDQPCDWCMAEAETELAARADGPDRVWPMDLPDAFEM